VAIRTLIVDDEVLARRSLRTLLAEESEFEVVGEARNGREAATAIASLSPDVVFLDVQMPALDGFGVIEKVGVDRMPLVVFVTAHDEHALRAFEVHAVDYLVKPFDRARFTMTTNRLKQRVEKTASDEARTQLASLMARLAPPEPEYASRFLVKRDGSMVVVRANEVEWIEADGNYVRLHVVGAAHLLTETMQNLESTLDPRAFIRVHRSAIVRVDAIREIQPWFNGGLVLLLKGGAKVQVSRGQRERVLAAVGGAPK
jgi:two-component system, LytTR family, response regulator